MIMEEGRQDFKGQSIQSMLEHRNSVSDGQFAMVRLPGPGDQEIPVLVCFMPVKNLGTLLLSDPVADTEQSGKLLERRMVLGIQERLDSLEL